MTPDERTALNEAVCKRLGWTKYFVWLDVEGGEHVGWSAQNGEGWYHDFPPHDFTSDWNAVYRWIVPAVQERGWRHDNRFTDALEGIMSARLPEYDQRNDARFFDATPEDYCRAFLAVTEVNDAR